ncbi:MAG: alkaline phosphatase family protein [Thermoleophilia bacterium]|nr:alkaline phosphatase family protein [Thermoleophilia bacterium]
MFRKLVLAVIDGLTPDALDRGLERGRLPALRLLLDAGGQYVRGVSTFPSVTPVCLSAIATGAGPDVHGIPHLAWYHRGEGRIVEYGSSLAAIRATGLRGALRDSVAGLSRDHLSPGAITVFEQLGDAGLVTAAVNFTCYRGRHTHRIRLPGVAARNRWYESVDGPERFFFFNLFESDATGAPLAVRSRAAGSVDAYAAAVGRWLITRDGFDFLVYYLPDYDYASHGAGPEGAGDALERADSCLGRLFAAAGGPDEFLSRYAIIVSADHGQMPVGHAVRLERTFAGLRLLQPRRQRAGGADLVVTASNRAGMVYRLPGCPLAARELAERLDRDPAADVVLFLEGAAGVARRGGAELRFEPSPAGWLLEGSPEVLDPGRYPNGLERAWRALRCPAAGEVIVSAAEGYEFVDLGGRHHAGGGSHGSLLAGDSLVPVIQVGLADGLQLPPAPSITDLAPLVAGHFGLDAPGARAPAAVAGV